ncbi:hypothetical protein [Pontibacter kalidii]|uniref:hypothetical protein n=1 Tax=Pontibacter kalidii TaxID=2592049 RepID=UPI002253AC76|nr:hypothetical protein [Pontibacter kalidii]
MRRTRTELLYRSTSLAIEFNPVEEWIYANWRGYQNYESVVLGCEKLLELMKEKACFRILNDNTHVEGQWSTAAGWVAADWFPRMRASGLQVFAWVYSPSVFSRLSVDKSIKLAEFPDYIKVFEDIALAKDWLRAHI